MNTTSIRALAAAAALSLPIVVVAGAATASPSSPQRRYTALSAAAATSRPSVHAVERSNSITSTTTDAWQQTNSNINISGTGGVETQIMTMTLPKGSWVLHADETIVNFGPSDYAGCSLFNGSTHLNTHGTMVGDSTMSGSQGPGTYLATVAETAALKLAAPSTIVVTCSHLDTNGSVPYVNSNADLWAHKAGSLSITQLP